MSNVTNISSHSRFRSKVQRQIAAIVPKWLNSWVTTTPLEPLVFHPKEGKFLKMEKNHDE